MTATWSLLSAAPPAALAIIELRAGDRDGLDRALGSIGLAIAPGAVVLADLLGVDEGLAVRWSEDVVHLTPHGGSAVIGAICDRLTRAGLEARAPRLPKVREGDVTSIRTAAMAAVASARSPLAVDLLLDQPQRWVEGTAGAAGAAGEHPRPDVLRRLIDPPLVVALGRPNIGKSTLVNALAGQSVAVIGDAPGVTRDAVGVALDLGGLAVRYLDAPGVGDRPGGDGGPGAPGSVDEQARSRALAWAREADLVLLCGDPASAPVSGPDLMLPESAAVRRIALRADLRPGWSPPWACDAMVSAATGRGLTGLVRVIRDALVPPEILADRRPWRFWG